MDISSLRERRDMNALTVSELNNMVKSILENASLLQRVLVRGELSNVNLHSSGHIYFTLKDTDSQVKCIMFRSSALSLRFTPKDGMRVILSGTLGVYTKGGSYQIYASSMQPDGIGALYLAYNELKAKLEEEGLFDENHKKLLPAYPLKIGVITSPTGAAVRDIIRVCARRFPLSHLYLYPSLVQGEGAEENLLQALDYFEQSHLVDVVIIGRGGGSIEDLWAFNSEKLARKIYEMNTPVVSAVGHETDFTICDFVADMRAPTPSAAAEIVTPEINGILYHITELEERVRCSLHSKIDSLSTRLNNLVSRPVLQNASGWLFVHNTNFEKMISSLNRISENIIQRCESEFALLLTKLDTLSPLSVLKRGYSIVKSVEGKHISSVSQLSFGDEINIRLFDGDVTAKVTKK